MVFGVFWILVCSMLRRMAKWFLRRTTGLCELQRICYGEVTGAPRILNVERSLHSSKDHSIKSLIIYMNNMSEECKLQGEAEKQILQHAILIILQSKRINPIIHNRFGVSFGVCVQQIWGYKQLYHEVDCLRKTTYDSDNLEHESKLLKLWRVLMPNVELRSRISKQWQDIGFQGDDPKTDFRGMGILGLDNLLFFGEEYSIACQHALSHSMHPKFGYTFAIVGINITSLAYRLLKDGALKTHIYNVSKSLPTVRIFHQCYCYLFYEFDKFWIESEPRDIMDFSRIFDEFEQNVRLSLMNYSTVFGMNLVVDNI